jgi:hypothetical protein
VFWHKTRIDVISPRRFTIACAFALTVLLTPVSAPTEAPVSSTDVQRIESLPDASRGTVSIVQRRKIMDRY